MSENNENHAKKEEATAPDLSQVSSSNTGSSNTELSSSTVTTGGTGLAGSTASASGAGPMDSMPQSDEIDWSEIEAEKKEIQPEFGKDYDPRPQEDSARRYIAYLLITLLIYLIAHICLMVWYRVIQVTEIKEFSAVLGPIVTLVSAATGFYYGTKTPK